MSDKIVLNAEPRSDLGKGASRRLRRAGLVPAIIYGGNAEPLAVTLNHNVFINQLDNENQLIYTQILSMKVGKTRKEDVILRDLQRHPFKNLIMHADFQRVDQKETLHVSVPLHFINEDICHGVKMEGGLLNHLQSEIEIACLPKDMPDYLEVDVENLKLGESLHLSDIKAPDGVEIVALTHGEDHDVGVAAVTKARDTSETEEETEVEGEAGEEGAAEE